MHSRIHPSFSLTFTFCFLSLRNPIYTLVLLRTHACTLLFHSLYPFCFLSLLSAIYIELYYVYAAVWGHYAYTLYGILFLVKNSILLIEVLVCVLGIH